MPAAAYRLSAGQRKVTMTKKWIAINLLLLAMAGLLGRYVRNSIHKVKQENLIGVKSMTPDPKKIAVEQGLPLPEQPRLYGPGEFTEILDKNLFTETRSNVDPTPAAPPTPEVVIPPLAQKPILVATVISDTRQVAYIVDPSSASRGAPGGGAPAGPPGLPGGGAPGVPGSASVTSRRAMVKKVGDTYQGYTITRITTENIVLEAGNRREIIPLHEGSKQPKGGKTNFIPTRIASFGPSTGTGAGAGRGPASGVPGATPVGGSVVGISATAQPSAQPNPGGSAGAGRGTPPSTGTSTPAGSASAQPQPARNVVVNPDGSRIVRTPFGDIPQ
jgi:hypothetical protein